MEICGYISKDGVPCTRKASSSAGLCNIHLRQKEHIYKSMVNGSSDLIPEHDKLDLTNELDAMASMINFVAERIQQNSLEPDEIRRIGNSIVNHAYELEGVSEADRHEIIRLGTELLSEKGSSSDKTLLASLFRNITDAKRVQLQITKTVTEQVDKKQLQGIVTGLVSIINDEVTDRLTKHRLVTRIIQMFGIRPAEPPKEISIE